MRKFMPFVVVGGIALLAGCGGSGGSGSGNFQSPPPVTNTATVDFGTSNQIIRGFGGSDAWMPVMPNAEVNALFGTGSGEIGLSILRVRIDPSSSTPGSQWDTEVMNAQHAIAAGSSVTVIATPWTPPAAWKSNGSAVMGSLNTGNYGNYANYLQSFVTYMANANPPVPLYGISLQNEPDANVTYESCVWSPQQIEQWVANNVAGVLTTRLIIPESESFNTSYSDASLNDASAVGNVGIVAGHIYGASPFYYTNAVNAGKDVWMTEHYLNPAGSQPSISDALQAAQEIHNSLTVGGYNAYLWWWIADWNPGGGITNTGLVDTNKSPTYYGWAIAQFARFLRPGYVRSNATSNAPANVLVSAYKGSGHFVIVAINMTSSSVDQTFTLQNQSITSMTPYVTTASEQVAQQSAVSVMGNQFTYTLPAQSIATFVQ